MRISAPGSIGSEESAGDERIAAKAGAWIRKTTFAVAGLGSIGTSGPSGRSIWRLAEIYAIL
jgi:hypothetical protein